MTVPTDEEKKKIGFIIIFCHSEQKVQLIDWF